MDLNETYDPDLWHLIAKDIDFCLDLKIGNQSISFDAKQNPGFPGFLATCCQEVKHVEKGEAQIGEVQSQDVRRGGKLKPAGIIPVFWACRSHTGEDNMGQTSQELTDKSQDGTEEYILEPHSKTGTGRRASKISG